MALHTIIGIYRREYNVNKDLVSETQDIIRVDTDYVEHSEGDHPKYARGGAELKAALVAAHHNHIYDGHNRVIEETADQLNTWLSGATDELLLEDGRDSNGEGPAWVLFKHVEQDWE